MKNYNKLSMLCLLLLGSTFFLLIQIRSTVALDDPDYTFTLSPQEYAETHYSQELPVNTIIQCEFEVVSGGNLLIDHYLVDYENYQRFKNEQSFVAKKVYEDSNYANYEYMVPFNDYYYLIFRNPAVFIYSKTVHVNLNLIFPTPPENPSILIEDGASKTYSDFVDVDLSCDNADEMCFYISSSQGSTGWTDWEVFNTTKRIPLPNPQDDTEYTIRVKYRNMHGESDIALDTIVFYEPPSIEITKPTADDVIDTSTFLIEWTTTGGISYINIDLYEDDSLVENLLSNGYDDGSYQWFLGEHSYDGNDFRIRIEDAENDSIFDYSDFFTLRPYSENDGYSGVEIPGFLFFPLLLFTLASIISLTKYLQKRVE